DEAIRQVAHQSFPLVHRVDDMERRQPLIGDLPFDQSTGHDAGRPAARHQHGIGNRTHEPDPSAPIDELDFLLDQNLSGLPSGVQKGWVFPGTGTAEYANPHAMVTFAVERRLRYALRVATTSSKDRAPGLFVVTNRKFTGA